MKRSFLNKRIIAASILTCTLTSFSQEPQKSFFGGGMALQTGYVSVPTPDAPAKGLIRGLGGKLHFNLRQHFRIGGTGASVTLNYNNSALTGSYFSLGYGGITAEGVITVNRLVFSAGALFGGGKSTNLHIISTNGGIVDSAYFTKTGTIILSPIFTIEYKFNRTLHLMLMIDYLFGNTIGSGHSLGGPKAIIGILFNK